MHHSSITQEITLLTKNFVMFCRQILINALKKSIAEESRFNDFPISIKFLKEELKYENEFLYDQNLFNIVVVLG